MITTKINYQFSGYQYSFLTSNGIVDGLFGFLYTEGELMQLWSDLVPTVVEHQRILEISH